jgi:hypothetical protein
MTRSSRPSPFRSPRATAVEETAAAVEETAAGVEIEFRRRAEAAHDEVQARVAVDVAHGERGGEARPDRDRRRHEAAVAVVHIQLGRCARRQAAGDLLERELIQRQIGLAQHARVGERL